MGEQFTGTFVLDDSQAQNTLNKTKQQLAQQDAQITNNKHRLDAYFQWAMHMATIWSSYLSRTAQGQAMIAKYQGLNNALNIISAELSIALTTKRALSDYAAGNYGAAVAQTAIATSLQFILVDMQTLKAEQDQTSAEIEASATYWEAYA